MLKRKRILDDDEPEIDFPFTPTRPKDAKSPRNVGADVVEPSATRSSRLASKKSSAPPPKDASSSRDKRDKVAVGVSTKVASKASYEHEVDAEEDTSKLKTPPHPRDRAASSKSNDESTRADNKENKALTLEPEMSDDEAQQEKQIEKVFPPRRSTRGRLNSSTNSSTINSDEEAESAPATPRSSARAKRTTPQKTVAPSPTTGSSRDKTAKKTSSAQQNKSITGDDSVTSPNKSTTSQKENAKNNSSVPSSPASAKPQTGSSRRSSRLESIPPEKPTPLEGITEESEDERPTAKSKVTSPKSKKSKVVIEQKTDSEGEEDEMKATSETNAKKRKSDGPPSEEEEALLSPLKKHKEQEKEGKAPTSTHQRASVARETTLRDSKGSVPLEENLVSYWDFVNEKRGERLLQKMKRDKRRPLEDDEEETLRVVKKRFYSEAERVMRPADQFVHNPINDELLSAVDQYQRILDLLERENEELTKVNRRVKSQLDEEILVSESDVKSKATSSSVATPTKKGTRSAPQSAQKKVPQRRASMAAGSSSSKTKGDEKDSNEHEEADNEAKASVDEILRHMPPAQSLLSEEEMAFLEVRPALATNLQQSQFSRLQTKFDALQLLVKQVGDINETLDQKCKASSAAMRSYMMPTATSNLNINRMKSSSATATTNSSASASAPKHD